MQVYEMNWPVRKLYIVQNYLFYLLYYTENMDLMKQLL